jgi:hypothetical protein
MTAAAMGGQRSARSSRAKAKDYRSLAYDFQELVKDLHIDDLVRLCPEQLVLVALLV